MEELQPLPFLETQPSLLFNRDDLSAIQKKTGIDLERLFKEGKCSINTEHGTIIFNLIDLFSLPIEIRKNIQLLLPFVLEQTQQGKDIERESQPELTRMNSCFLRALNFHREYLLVNKFPRDIQKLEKNGGFDTIEEFLKFLRKTTDSKRKASGYAPLYCAIATTMLGENLRKNSVLVNLESKCDDIRDSFFEQSESGATNFFKIRNLGGNWEEVIINASDESIIKAKMSHRGKNDQRTLAKLLMKAEWNIEEAVKDALGFLFEAKTKTEAAQLLVFLKKFLSEKFDITLSEIEETHFFNQSENELKEKLQSILGTKKNEKIISNNNPNVHQDFQSIKITGNLSKKNQGNIIYGTQEKLPFEVVIVLIDNKNEVKMSRHEVYEAVQKLSVFTRLYGSFSEKYLDKICNEASIRSQKTQGGALLMSSIKKYIIHESLYLVNDKSEGKKYASRAHIDRWKAIGFVPEDFKFRKP